MTRRCSRCQRVFTPRRNSHTRCWSCWKVEADEADEATRSQAYSAGYQAGRRDARPAEDALEPSLAKRAVRLCHPDLHSDGRKREATEVTQELLDIANGARRVETRALSQ